MNLVACVQIPSFAIALARRDDARLAERPLVLYTADQPRATVYAASDDVGASRGMALRQVVLRCPHAIYHPADPARDQCTLTTLVALLQAFSPRVAVGAELPDAHVELDLGGSTLAQAIAQIQQIAQRIRTTLGLTSAIGAATTRFVAQRAAITAGGDVGVVIPPGREPTFLAPQPVTALPLDRELLRRLELLGLHTLGALAALPIDALQAQFGAAGRALYRLAHGVDDSPIQLTPSTPMLTRTWRFAGPVGNWVLLETAIGRLADHLATDLHAGGWAARSVELTLIPEDSAPWSSQRTLSEPTADRATLTQVFLALSRTAELNCGVEAVTLGAPELVQTVASQLSLFVSERGQTEQLRGVLTRLHTRYRSCFVRARLTNPTSQVIEQRVRFDPWERV